MEERKININKIFWLLLLLIFVVRILLAIVFSHQGWPRGSSFLIRHEVPINLLAGKGFEVKGYPSLYLTPLYPVLVAISYYIFGVGWFGVAVLQAFLSVLAGYYLYKLSILVTGNTRIGLVSLATFCFYPYLAISAVNLFDTVLFTTILLGLVYHFWSFLESCSQRRMVITGIFSGLGILARPSILTLLVAIGGWFLYDRFKKGSLVSGQTIKYLIYLVVPIVIVWSPWVLRNYRVSDEIIPTCLAGQHAFWWGNNEYINKVYKDGFSPDLIGQSEFPIRGLDEFGRFHGVSPQEQILTAHRYFQAAKNWIKENPDAFLESLYHKFVALWSWKYFPRYLGGWEKNIKFWQLRQVLYSVSYFPILLLSIWAVTRFPNRDFVNFILLMMILFTIGSILMVTTPRHRVPLDPFLMLLASERIIYLYHITKKRSLKSIVN